MTTTKLSKPKVLFIVGPTTSHKTALAIKLANQFNGEIINADAFQVYKMMTIGTNAPTNRELRQAKFHLNQCINIDEEWDIKKFQTLANYEIKKILENNKLPIVVGGSNLYVDSIIKNYALDSPKRSDEYEDLTNDQLFNELNKLNSEIALKIGVNNRKRLLRAIEVIKNANNPYQLVKNNPINYDCFIIECNYPSRSQLYSSINNKVDEMFNDGWIDEVKKIANHYSIDFLKSCNAFKAIGYLDILNSIINQTKINQNAIKQNIRHYAKRQITWIKHKFRVNAVYLQDNLPTIIDEVNTWIKK